MFDRMLETIARSLLGAPAEASFAVALKASSFEGGEFSWYVHGVSPAGLMVGVIAGFHTVEQASALASLVNSAARAAPAPTPVEPTPSDEPLLATYRKAVGDNGEPIYEVYHQRLNGWKIGQPTGVYNHLSSAQTLCCGINPASSPELILACLRKSSGGGGYNVHELRRDGSKGEILDFFPAKEAAERFARSINQRALDALTASAQA